jgi:photosystem I subunit 4
MTSKTPNNPRDNRQDEDRYDPQDNPGVDTEVPITEEGDTPLDERYRMTGQEAGTDVRSGSENEAPGGAVKRPGLPNQGTDSR